MGILKKLVEKATLAAGEQVQRQNITEEDILHPRGDKTGEVLDDIANGGDGNIDRDRD